VPELKDIDGVIVVNARGLEFREIPMESCIDLAKSLAAEGHHWHSHAIWPGCAESPYPRFAVLIEDSDTGRAYISPSQDFPPVDKALVRMLHGDDILDPTRSNDAGGPAESRVLDDARAAVANGAAWHHHMCFPDCAFNREPGKWTIVVETGGNATWESWDDEPADVLWEFEILCFGKDND
jgi:hypothetical protein